MSSSSSSIEPEVHFIGQIVGADFPEDSNGFASFSISYGSEWVCVGGSEAGQTQVDYPQAPETQALVWNHPIDLHFYTKSLTGWPQIVLECGKLDYYGNKQLIGYGFAYFPCVSGSHTLEIDIWRPLGTGEEETLSFFMGGSPTLVNTDLIANLTKAREERCHLYTKPSGRVFVNVDVLLRNLALHNVAGQGKPIESDTNYVNQIQNKREIM